MIQIRRTNDGRQNEQARKHDRHDACAPRFRHDRQTQQQRAREEQGNAEVEDGAEHPAVVALGGPFFDGWRELGRYNM